MAKAKKQTQKKKQTARQPPPAPRGSARKTQSMLPGLDGHAQQYLKMLANPCSGPIVTPLYAGTPGAYQVRLNRAVQPTFAMNSGHWPSLTGTAGEHIKLDVVCAYVPGLNVYHFWWAPSGVATITLGTDVQAYDFFDPANDLVENYRALAACTKFNPCGDYSTRSGVIGMALDSHCAYPTTGGVTAASSMSKALKRNPIGECVHEFVWAPSDADSAPNSPKVPIYSDSNDRSCMTTILCNVDAIWVDTTTVSLQGFFEFTGVYEWNPDYTQYGKDLSTQIPAVSRTPLNTALSYLGNVGNFAVNGFRAMQYANSSRNASRLLTAGVSSFTGRAPRSMLSVSH